MKLDFENGNYCGSRKAWNAKRVEILQRAQNCCEGCGVKNYAVGYYRNSVLIQPIGRQNGNPIVYSNFKDASFNAKSWNEIHKEDGDNRKYIVVVLTISHTDHNTQNNDNSNLKALCQKCHINHDKHHHAKNARVTREKKKGLTNKLF